MTRLFLCGLALIGVAACQPAVPDSGAGVGFDRIDAERRARDAQLERGGVPAAPGVTTTTLDSADASAAARARAANSGVAPLEANPSNPAPGSAGISNENDFTAVSNRRSIEADAARTRANAERFEVIQPTALPQRSGNSGPNVVAYALRTSHPRGQQVHRRTGLRSQAKFQRNCAAYPSADAAQLDFLARGGPQKDRQNLDPDGDGYACGWDPAPFRAIRGASAQPAAAPQPSIVPAGAISTE